MPQSLNDAMDLAKRGFPEEHRLYGLEEQVIQLQGVGILFYNRGWSVGTSSNYSVVSKRDPLELLVTASGIDKGRLGVDDFVRINAAGEPVVPNQPKSSAETMLHVVAANKLPWVGAILHTHSIWATILSDRYFEDGGMKISGFEMLKGLLGVKTHQTDYWLPIFENTQDIPHLAEQVGDWLDQSAPPYGVHGYLIRKHGLYTWGKDLDEALRHIEIFEFLLECIGRQLLLK